MISDRKKLILNTIIKEYIKSAQPVSSGVLVNKYKLKVSPATVRNEMMDLEDEGYIYQPHTSAGRVPTEMAYKLFLEEVKEGAKTSKLKDSELKLLEDAFDLNEKSFRQTAKVISELGNGAVFWAFHKNDLYYTGLSQLFAQPEFNQSTAICDASLVIDRLEEIIDAIFEELNDGEHVFIGTDNPFGHFLSTTILKYRRNNSSGLLGILGPMRMDYAKNIQLIKFIKNKLS